MKHPVTRVFILACALIFIRGLSGETETYTVPQDGVTAARQISMDIQPFGPDGTGWLTVVGLEGLGLSLLNEGDILVLDDGHSRFAWSGADDGWYRLDIVKRYLSQDLEILVDGLPAILSSPAEGLDLLLAEDHLVLVGDSGTGAPPLASLSVRNLDYEPQSILDWGNLSSGSDRPYSDNLSVDSSAAVQSSTKPANASPETAAELTQPDSESADAGSPETGSASSSRLFTPLF